MAKMKIVMSVTRIIEFTPGEKDKGYDHLGADATAQDYLDFEVSALTPDSEGDFTTDPVEFVEVADEIEFTGEILNG